MWVHRLDAPRWRIIVVAKHNLDLLTCVVVVTAAVLVAIARCTGCTIRLPHP